MSCPICNNTELYDGAEVCPKCGSDIEVFSHIDARKEYFTQKKSILVLAAVLGVVVVSWGSVSLFSGNKTTEMVEISPEETVKAIAPVPDSAALAAVTEKQLLLEKENEELKSELASIKSAKASTPVAKAPSVSKGKKKAKTKTTEAAPSTEKSEGGFITHTVKRGDNPWTISKRYFHNGSHAKQIVADNNLQNMKNIPIGTKLKIQK